MQEGVLQKIPNKADQNIYTVITDFADKRYGVSLAKMLSAVNAFEISDIQKMTEGTLTRRLECNNVHALVPGEIAIRQERASGARAKENDPEPLRLRAVSR